MTRKLAVGMPAGTGLPGVMARLGQLRHDPLAKTLLSGAGGLLVVNVAGMALAFALQLLLARTLGVSGYGQYVFALGCLNVFLGLGRLGLGSAILRFVPAYRGREQWDLLRGFLRRTGQSAILAAVTLGTIAAGLVWLIGPRLEVGLAACLLWTCLMLPVYLSIQLASSTLSALKRVVAAQTPILILRPCLLAVGVLLLVRGFGRAPGTAAIMCLHLVAAIAVLAVLRLQLKRSLPGELGTATPQYQNRQWSAAFVGFTTVGALGLISDQADLLLVGGLLGTTEAGIYGVAVRFTRLLNLEILAVNTIVMPLISELYAQGRLAELQRTITLAARALLVGVLPLAGGLILLGGPLLAYFGPEFTSAYLPLVILTLAQVVTASVASVGVLLTMTGYQSQAVRVHAVTSTLGLLFCLLLIPTLGTLGAAVAKLLATCTWAVILVVYVGRTLKIDATPWGRLRLLGDA